VVTALEQPAGPIVDGLGITLDVDEGCLVSDAVLLAKVIGPDGTSIVAISDNPSMDWLTQYALIKAAERIIDTQQFLTVGEDDD
jgi:hypothetical protein